MSRWSQACCLLVAAACSSTPGKGRSPAGGQPDAAVDAAHVDGAPLDGTATEAGTDAQPPRVALCDQSPQLRLWVLVEPQLGRELPGSQVRVENGLPFLIVDGTCSYWISAGWIDDPLSRDRGIRTGRLTARQVATIEQAVPLGDVGPLGDCAPKAGQFDVSTRTIAVPAASARCSSTGTRFDAAWSALGSLAQSLWQTGTPMGGPLRVSAVAAPDGASSSPPPYRWPIASPLGGFILEPGKDGMSLNQAGASHLLSDEQDANTLRAMREQYLLDRSAQPGLYSNWDGLKSTDDADTALVYMRDALPYEDASGLLRF